MPEDEPKPQPAPAITPRRNPNLGRSVPEDEEDEELTEWNDLVHNVKALSHQMGVGGPAPAAQRPAAPKGRDKTIRRWKKVTKPGSPESKDSQSIEVPGEPVLTLPGQSQPPAPAAPAVAAPTPTVDAPAPPAPPVRVRSPRPAIQRRKAPALATAAKRHPILVQVAAQVFGFGLLLTGFALGKFLSGPETNAPAGQESSAPGSTVSANPAAIPLARGVSERAFQVVERILAAGKKGDAEEVKRLLLDAQREHIDVPASDYRMATIALQRGDGSEAKLRLECAEATNEQIGAWAYLRALLHGGAGGDYAQAVSYLTTAVYSDPFSARYLFYLGEVLRRDGKPAAAVERLEQSLNRPGIAAADADYIAYKLRLAKIEASRDGEFETELAERLKADPVQGTWLLTAAAQRLQRGKPAEAADFLQRATRQMPPDDFNRCLGDFFYVPYSKQQEVAPYFIRKAPAPAAVKSVNYNESDPAYWPLQKADPGNWPQAAPSRSSAPFR